MSSAALGTPGTPPTALQFDVPPPLACSETPPTVAWFSTALALTAYHCGAKPWSEPATVVGSPPISCARPAELLVGVRVRAADVVLADRDAVRLRRPDARRVAELRA